MRIAVFGVKAMPAFAGADRVAERIVEHLPQHEYLVYVLRDGPAPRQVANRRYVRVPAPRGKHLRAFSYFLLCALHFLAFGRADVAHVHNSDFGLFVPLLRLRHRLRVVGTFHGSHFGPFEREKWGRGAHLFLRLSEWMFVRTCHVLTTVAPLPTDVGRVADVIPNGADTWDGGPEAAEPLLDSLGLARGEYVLFACGRLDRTKGLHHLLAAYRLLPGAPRLLVVADFSHDAGYSRSIEDQAGDDPRIVLHRSLLDRDTLFSVIAASTIFVFPSEFEAMSMMLLEVVACRKTVVCSDIAENRMIVGDDYPLLFRSGDADDLAAVLQRALADPSAPGVAAAFERVKETFQWPAIAERYDAVYRGSVPAAPSL
jgi:glycosyltransferase involved in cell wall biosynthesis